MEKAISVEERIRRAEEIYQRRRQGVTTSIAKVPVTNNKKDVKLLKKMIIQILICIFIYMCIYSIYNNKYVFSEHFINKANEILSYDMNFQDLYNNIKSQFQVWFTSDDNVQEENKEVQEEQKQEDTKQEGIGGAGNIEQIQLSQTEQDIQDIKNTTTFIKPVEGIISSAYGQRDSATGTVPKNHTGIDIAANTGTKIKSATNGEVVLVSEEGDYGKHVKIQVGEVSIIYAHCNKIYVKQGDKIIQGQEIAEVGSTGNSTGPHLHFEIRIHERTVNPQDILNL